MTVTSEPVVMSYQAGITSASGTLPGSFASKEIDDGEKPFIVTRLVKPDTMSEDVLPAITGHLSSMANGDNEPVHISVNISYVATGL